MPNRSERRRALAAEIVAAARFISLLRPEFSRGFARRNGDYDEIHPTLRKGLEAFLGANRGDLLCRLRISMG